ncbi:MAG: patatin-like phospholipase family protein [Caulobacteraceae bacterium]
MPAPSVAVAQPMGFAGVRLSFEEAEASLEAAADRLALPRPSLNGDEFNVLAISGGAAGGAYGAGILVGLSEVGRRPRFGIVTGVSTGALLAPFAFLGSAWDRQLTQAYTGGRAAEEFGLSSLSGFLEGGLLSAASLDDLIAAFIDETMLEAVAAEHRLGRRLLVATTDLDSQRPAIWDMGEIACRGGPAAVAMFRLVLAASASLPGLFPPRLIRCEVDGQPFDELHVDGGVTTPLFILPEALMHWRKLGRRMHRGRIYVIVNTVLDPSPCTTPPNLPSILLRSFDTMLRVSYRQALNVAVTFSAAHNLPLSVASIPDAPSGAEIGSMLSFDTATMKRTFDAAVDAAKREDFWKTPTARQDLWSDVLDLFQV